VLRIDPAVFERRIATSRPVPPDDVGEDVPERFVPDPAFVEWIRDTFIAATGPLANIEHEHLMDAHIGVLWTNAVNVSKMRHVLATAEIPQTMGGAWKRGRAEQQMQDWFGFAPHFVLTFYAPECARLTDRSFCALVEHELYHCAQAENHYGAPRFDRVTGEPIYAIRGHDVEVFTGEVRRYGMVSPDVRDLLAAAKARPEIGDALIGVACGTCARGVA
jgi:hypothetical protein